MISPDQHNLTVKEIQKQMEGFFAEKKKVKIYHGSTNSTRAQKFKKGEFVDISNLNNVLEVNKQKQYVIVEPNVPMDKLVKETLKYGLIPSVVPEFPGITVGGGIQGGAGESSSFKYEGVHNICLEYEVVLGNGKLVIASRTQNEDLFHGIPCSYGSLGIITKVKMELIPAPKFVHLTYHKVNSFNNVIELTKNKVKEKIDFIDAIMFTENRGVVMTGAFSDKKELPVSKFSRAFDQWFYLHADKISQKDNNYEELIPIEEYLFRYNRGGFWMGKHGLGLFPFPFNRFVRFILNIFLKTRSLYSLLHAMNVSQRYIVQDIALPIENSVKFLEYINNDFGIYPLWIVPLKPGTTEKLSSNLIKTDLVINVGVWGAINKNFPDPITANKALEKKANELGGRKWLYAHQYYESKDFWALYDYEWYNNLRNKYFANIVFPDLYEKTVVRETYKHSVVLGVLKFLIRPFKLPTN